MTNDVVLVLVSSLVSLIGAVIAIWYSQKRFSRSLKIGHYTRFIDLIEKAFSLNDEISSMKDASEKKKKTIEIELCFQGAYAVAMATMDDKMFKNIDKLLNGAVTIQKKNFIYYKMRKDLYPNTRILYENIMDRNYKSK